MPETPERPGYEQRAGDSRGRRRAYVTVILLVLMAGAVAILASAEGDRLSDQSGVDAPEQDETGVASNPESGPPVILSLTAATDRIPPWDVCEIVCEAFDQGGDELTYTWSASAGDIYGEGPRIEWGSPMSEGLYRISVVVENAHGNRAERSMSVRVKANTAPQITSIASDADWLFPGGSTLVWCEAVDVDGDEITYDWSASRGELFGQGASVIWLAPEEIGSYWITVTARDAYGGEEQRALPISVTPVEPPGIVAMVVEPIDTRLIKAHSDSWTIF